MGVRGAGDRAAPRPASQAEFEQLIARTWTEVLGTDDFDLDQAFFDARGDSVRLALVGRLIQEYLGGQQIGLTDLYRFPTVHLLAGHLHAQSTSGAS